MTPWVRTERLWLRPCGSLNRASISVLGKLGMKPIGRESVGGRPLLYYEIASAL